MKTCSKKCLVVRARAHKDWTNYSQINLGKVPSLFLLTFLFKKWYLMLSNVSDGLKAVPKTKYS